MKNINENKFYEALENIFTGANIEGDSGYVNLLKIKSKYYSLILKKFKEQVDNERIIDNSFKEEFFDKLYSFFEKYFSESGSVYFVKTANYQRVYEKVYTDNKDVVLFWKTHMLYYVKSDILFKSIDVNISDEEFGEYDFYFDVKNLQAKQNNEKKELVFTFREIQVEKTGEEVLNKKQGKKVFVFDVAYSERGKKTNIDNIVKKTKIPEEILQKAFKTFKKQSEVDFFINKNAEKFLTEQLDLYLHQILLNEENKFDQKRLDQLKTIKTFALKIIKFIAQFEDELVRVWNKSKFALNGNYVITIDKLNGKILQKIEKHKNLKEQIKEWQELGMVDDNFDFTKREEKKHKFLPIDTKYFKDLETEILSRFENIDEALDGRLIHSENYQALNTLKEKYKEKVQCIYIDPPFNTGSDFAYVDKFQDSTWLSLMYDRIKLARDFLRDDGSFYLHLDYNASHIGRTILDTVYNKNNFINEIIWEFTGGTDRQGGFQNKHNVIFLYQKTKERLFNSIYVDFAEGTLKRFNKISEDGRRYKENALSNGRKTITYMKEEGKIAPDYWNFPIINKTYDEFVNFYTQKPEKLLERIIKASSNENHYILDFFTGSATTIATAHKLNRKWLGVEMGEHFETVDLPRMKTVLFGKISGISKELEKEKKLNKGGFFKYYSLEQCEDTLRNMKYKDYDADDLFSADKKVFEEYIFYADKKFAHILDTSKKDVLKIDFEKLYKNIDFPETISNVLALPIKKITAENVILQDGEEEKIVKYDYKNMTEEEKIEFIKILKPLLWWGE